MKSDAELLVLTVVVGAGSLVAAVITLMWIVANLAYWFGG